MEPVRQEFSLPIRGNLERTSRLHLQEAGEDTSLTLRSLILHESPCAGMRQAENTADLHDASKSSARRRHLLVQLWALREAGGLSEIVRHEHLRPSFRRSGKELGAVNFHEALTRRFEAA